MAKLVGNKRAKAPAAKTADNELEVLHPERHLVLGGKKVAVREYGHVEWLRLLPRAEPMVAAIAAKLDAGREVSYEDALNILVEHTDALMPLVHQAADLADDTQLTPDDGELLLMTWWGVNGRFFVQRALNRVAIARTEAKRLAQLEESLASQHKESSATARSTQPSNATATRSRR